MPGFIGFPEIMLLGLVVLLLFGPKRLPEMGRGLGKGLREFKESVSGDDKAAAPTELTMATDLSAYEVPEPGIERQKVA